MTRLDKSLLPRRLSQRRLQSNTYADKACITISLMPLFLETGPIRNLCQYSIRPLTSVGINARAADSHVWTCQEIKDA